MAIVWLDERLFGHQIGERQSVLHIGTSGWQYRDWRGRLYADDLPQRGWLERYAEAYYDHPQRIEDWAREYGFDRALVILGEAMQRLADRGLLHGLADPVLAAYQFAGLVMYQPMNQVMFAGTDALPPAGQLGRIADAAVDMFLASYGPRPGG